MEEEVYTAEEQLNCQGEISQEEPSEATIENISNETLAKVVADGIEYKFTQYILVKPLEAKKVYKTLTVPEDSGEKDENGDPIMQMTIKEVEVDSNYREGIVIAIPESLKVADQSKLGWSLNIGDTIVYPNKRASQFDLYKDSEMVPPYEVVAIK